MHCIFVISYSVIVPPLVSLYRIYSSCTVDQEHYKMALALAEKYEDFAVMIKICEKEGNYEKIEKYKTTLGDKVRCFKFCSTSWR